MRNAKESIQRLLNQERVHNQTEMALHRLATRDVQAQDFEIRDREAKDTEDCWLNREMTKMNNKKNQVKKSTTDIDNAIIYKIAVDNIPFKVKIQQSAKGFSYFEVSVIGENKRELKSRLEEAVSIATEQVKKLNEVKEK